MDRLVDIIVRFMTLVARIARWLPWLHYEQWREGARLKVLLAGYNGARNTGADVRVAALIDQLDQALGPGTADFSVMTLDPIFHSQETIFPSGSEDLSANCTVSPATIPEAGVHVKSATGRLLVS